MRERQRQIITELNVEPAIDPLHEFYKRSQFLADYLAGTALNGYVLGISGGQDSLLAGLMAQRAANICKAEGREAAFHALLLPYGEQKDRDDALLAVETIEPDYVYDLNIKPGVDAFAESFAVAMGEELSDFDKGNAKARERMIAHYALAGAKGLLVLGTDHAAEAVTGFYTKYGDGGADVLPLAGLTKGQGKQMLQALQVPEIFTTKAPTADLLDGTPGQADETELGIPYDMLDDYLEGKEIDPATAEAIERRYAATQHKREMPVAF
ncbi:MAG: ammonia-dependent NAD(+) synthetase [Acidobacteriota bacterium]